MDFTAMGATEMLAGYRSGSFTPSDVVRSCVERAEETNDRFRALCFPRWDAAQAEAADATMRWVAGDPIGPLDGIPVLIKDNIAVSGVPSPKGAMALADASPEPEDGPPVARLREAGAIILAKTTMPDMGMMGSGYSTLYGHCLNPWDPSKNTSGSSSGSGAAIALGIAPIALGTDICGSVRNPAAWCGIVGYKPSYGRVPHLPPAMGRHCGPMTRTVEDTQLAMNVLARPDDRDYARLPTSNGDFLQPALDMDGVRIGVLIDLPGFPATDPSITQRAREAVEACRAAGATIVDLSDAGWADGMRAWRSYLGAFTARTFDGLGEERLAQLPRDMVEWARFHGPADARGLADALAAISDLRQLAGAAFAGIDFAIAPTLNLTPFAADATGPGSPDQLFDHLWYVGLFNATEQPACSLPWGTDARGMPVGIQVIGRRHDDVTTLRAARRLELLAPDLGAPEV